MEKWAGRVGRFWRELLSTMNSTNLTPDTILHPLIPPWSVLAGIVINYLALNLKHVKAAQKEIPTRIYSSQTNSRALSMCLN